MKTDHFEGMKISAKTSRDQAPWDPLRIAKNTTASSIAEKSEQAVPGEKSRKNIDGEIKVLTEETLLALRKFLASSIFHDVGPITAGKIVSAFGIRTAQVIKSSPHELLTVRGVGRKRMLAVLSGWTFKRRLLKDIAELTRLTPSDK